MKYLFQIGVSCFSLLLFTVSGKAQTQQSADKIVLPQVKQEEKISVLPEEKPVISSTAKINSTEADKVPENSSGKQQKLKQANATIEEKKNIQVSSPKSPKQGP